jgi:hypothetical protein
MSNVRFQLDVLNADDNFIDWVRYRLNSLTESLKRITGVDAVLVITTLSDPEVDDVKQDKV